MAITHTIGLTFAKDGSNVTQFSSSESWDGEINLDVTIAPAASNFSVICPISATNVKSVMIVATAAMTVVTKNGASTVDTFNFQANKPLLWQSGFPGSNPFTGDVTTLSVTSTPGGNLKVCILENV